MTQESLDNDLVGGSSRDELQDTGRSRYREYKDSDIAWLGEIPVHWDVAPVNQTYTIQLGKMLQNAPATSHDMEVPYLKAQHVQWFRVDTKDAPTMWANPSDVARFGLAKGDLLVCEGGEGGRCGILHDDADGFIIQNALHRVRPREPEARGHNDFLQYMMSSIAAAGWLDALSEKATIAHFTKDKFASLRVPIPPLHEQRTITAFLDRETAKIDALVAKKERLIELLQEKRIALVTRAVTKGLDPEVPMKDSGVEWLGEIPAHWEVLRLYRLTPSGRSIMYGIVLPGPNVQDGIPIVKGGDVSPDRLRLDRLNRTHPDIEAGYVRSRLRGGDLVYAIRGSLGDAAIVPDELDGANLTQDAARVAYTEATHGRWLLYTLKSAAIFTQLDAGALGATIRGINIRDLKRAVVPRPPQFEQQAIAAFLDQETAKIDAFLSKVRAAIDRLKELRIALISAAVTGKIDVRDEADPASEATP